MMKEKFFAKIPLPDGGCYGYAAFGPHAVEQLQEIAGITGAEPVESLPPQAFACEIIETPRAEIEQYFGPRPGFIVYSEPAMVIWVPEDFSGARVYLVNIRKSKERTGFLWRRLYYLALLSYAMRRKAGVVHGLLTEYNGSGAIISGPSGIGKSTAARRLPAPWKVLSDDCLLVTRMEDGFYAQPVPTWSIFFASSAPERCFDCARTVRLSRLFLLDRGADRAVPLDWRQSLLGFTRSVGDMTKIMAGKLNRQWQKQLFDRSLQLASDMARNLPGHHLYATLDGEFWKAMERVMEDGNER